MARRRTAGPPPAGVMRSGPSSGRSGPLRAVAAAVAVGAVLSGCQGSGDRGQLSPASTGRTAAPAPVSTVPHDFSVREYPVPRGSRPHDVAVARDGAVWYTAQGSGALGRLDPRTGEVRQVPLGSGSRPHGVIVGPDGALWVTDGGLNAILRVDPGSSSVRAFELPPTRPAADLNTAAFDRAGRLWFTGQAGIYGRLDPSTGSMDVFDAPGGPGPYGITATAAGEVYYASLAGDHIAAVDAATGAATVLQPPTADQGTRRVWADSRGRIWCSQWNAGQVAVFDPAGGRWREWRLPGERPQAYAVYVDERDRVWLSDFGSNALVRFDPERETFTSVALPTSPANVRQLAGRAGEVWGAESAADKLVVVRS